MGLAGVLGAPARAETCSPYDHSEYTRRLDIIFNRFKLSANVGHAYTEVALRNAARSRIKWMFTTDKARAKMGRAYPATSKES
jgi:hypothetical protein